MDPNQAVRQTENERRWEGRMITCKRLMETRQRMTERLDTLTECDKR